MMQLLKQIWNERRINSWLWVELLLVCVVLWNIVDWTYVIARTYYEPMGFNITDTYLVDLSIKTDKCASFIPPEKKTTTGGEDLLELVERLRRLPEVEAVSISNNSRPYIGSNSGMRAYLDTLECYMLRRGVTPDFFRVFRYESMDGRGYQPLVRALENGRVVVSENLFPSDYKGDRTLIGKQLIDVDDSTEVYQIAAVSKKVRYNDFWPNFSDRYIGMAPTEAEWAKLRDYEAGYMEVCLRVKPGTSAEFPLRLMELSDSQFSVGNLFIQQVDDYDDIRDQQLQGSFNTIKTRFWMVAFLLINILLGIIGTFWFRTQHRRAELGLRIAVGSTRIGLWNRLNMEGILLLTLAALPAAVICFNIGYSGLVEGSMEWNGLRFLVGFTITYILMVSMILLGIWFPARQAMKIQPAEALHEE